MAEPDPPRSKHARNLQIWTILGQLRDEVVRDIADRLRAGQRYDEISDAIGIGRKTGRRKCAEIAKLLGLQLERSQYEQDVEEVRRRAEAGEATADIAAAMGRSANSVNSIRRKIGLGQGRVLRFTREEENEVERRLMAGDSTRAIASATGCEQADVARRRKRIAHLIPTDLPPCECGKPRNHGGRCDLVVDPALVRERLLAGKTATDIAREFNRTAQSFKPKYVDPIIAQLTLEGHRCACGRPFGHQVGCEVTMRAQRSAPSPSERTRATDLARRGCSIDHIRCELGITMFAARALVTDVRAELAAEGVLCPCGDRIDHRWSCSSRNGQSKRRTAFRFTSSAAGAMSQRVRTRISKFARAGHPLNVIVKRTGETAWRVTQLVDELGAAGRLPDRCAGCEHPYRHRGPCPKPRICRCGRPRNHRGLCRRADGRKRVLPTKLSRAELAEVRRLYRARCSGREISRRTGLSLSVVQRVLKRWRDRSKYEFARCPCGRPARHAGGCIVNTPGAVGKREQARIETWTRQGLLPHQIASRLDLSVQSVLRHSIGVRDAMFAEGVSCSCGRPIGHPYWCSAKWDAHGQPRGRRPFPEPTETLATEALERGEVVADIAKVLGAGVPALWRLRKSLSDNQRQRRATAIRKRLALGASGKGADLMARIQAAVPRGVQGALRDDVIGELYLAVIEGRVEIDEIRAVVRSFVSRGISEWESNYGPRGIDEAISKNVNRSIADTIGDDTTAGQVDTLTLGGDG